MPTYEYACKSCGRHHEVQQSFTDDALTTCPTCGGPLRKVFGNIAISFKGSGFYSTDNRSVGKAGASSGKGDGDSPAGDSKSDKAEKSDAAASSSSSESSSSGESSSSSESAKPAKPAKAESPKSGEKTAAAAP
jgi:putative FmdB family regulatory protein